MNHAQSSLAVLSMALGGSAAALAQQAPDWTPEEAGVPVLMRILAARNKDLGSEAQALGRAHDLPGTFPRVETDTEGVTTCGGYSFRLHNAENGATGPGFVIYAWPAVATAGRRAFAVTAGGEVLATDGASAVYGATRMPEWSAAVASGVAPSLARVLVAPGKGGDGQTWSPVTARKPVATELFIRDAGVRAGNRIAVAVGPRCWFENGPSCPLDDIVVPAGIAQVGADGRILLAGVAVPGLHLGLLVNGVQKPARIERVQDGLVVTFGVGRVVAARATANESAAIATLRNTSSAQGQCQASGLIDVDRDGTGEYGFFAELAGGVPLRGPGPADAARKMDPAIMPISFAKVRGGRLVRSGYLFQIFLPGKDGAWVAEADLGGSAGVAVDAKAAAVRWRCYAWPMEHGVSGTRAFVVDEAGVVLASDNAGGRYDGDAKPLCAEAAVSAKPKESKLAVGGKGKDGSHWTVVD